MLEQVNRLMEIIDSLEKFSIENDTRVLDSMKNNYESQEIKVAVMGAMKSGKSTLVNAMIRRDLMPNENDACTYTTTFVTHGKYSGVISKEYHCAEKEKVEIQGEELEQVFLEEVRRTRENNEIMDFHYEVEIPIHTLEHAKNRFRFSLVDVPGYDEMENPVHDTKQIQNIIDDTLRRINYIVYVLDYQYYKSEVNRAFLEKIAVLRPDLMEGKKVVFVLNKVDTMSSNDLNISKVVDSIKDMLNEWGFGFAEVYPLVSQKALLGRMLEDGYDMGMYSAQLEKYIEPVERIIEGKTMKVKDLNAGSSSMISESGICTFEEEVIARLHENSNFEVLQDLQRIVNRSTNELLELINLRLSVLNDKKRDQQKEINQEEKKLEAVQSSLRICSELKREITNQTTSASKKEIYKKKFSEGIVSITRCPYPKDYLYNYHSDYQAEQAGLDAFRRWKQKLEVLFDFTHQCYSSALAYHKKDENYFYAMIKLVETQLKKGEELVNRELVKVDKGLCIRVLSNIHLVPEPLEALSYDYTTRYINDIYDNSTFVSTDETEEYIGESIFGNSKYKSKYCYDTSKARKEEMNDHQKGANKASEHYFEDYYQKKYVKFPRKLQAMAIKEVERIESELVRKQNEFLKTMNEFKEQSYVDYDGEIESLEEICLNLKGEGVGYES